MSMGHVVHFLSLIGSYRTLANYFAASRAHISTEDTEHLKLGPSQYLLLTQQGTCTELNDHTNQRDRDHGGQQTKGTFSANRSHMPQHT